MVQDPADEAEAPEQNALHDAGRGRQQETLSDHRDGFAQSRSMVPSDHILMLSSSTSVGLGIMGLPDVALSANIERPNMGIGGITPAQKLAMAA